MIPDGAWDRVLELLNEASHGSIKYDPNHFEWNFGFNLMSLEASRRINMSATYERLASRLLSLRYLRGDSLVYGLGVPFLAYANRIECYTRAGWYVLDGLGYVPPAEMEVAGVTLQTISDAPVLHYNGERKPWGTNPFAEYVKAMGYWGQNLTGLPTTNTKPVTEGKSLKLVVLLSGPRTGTEWLAKVMADDNELVCGSIDDRTAPHPESLMPYDVAVTLSPPCEHRESAHAIPTLTFLVDSVSHSVRAVRQYDADTVPLVARRRAEERFVRSSADVPVALCALCRTWHLGHSRRFWSLKRWSRLL